jgi:predicted nucleotidyltransferase
MKHEKVLSQLVADAERDPNVLGFLVFGSVARGTHREDSDIDVLTVLGTNNPTSGINNISVEGIKVGTLFFTEELLRHSVKTVPYLLHPLGDAQILFDRHGEIKPLQERIRDYFSDHPEIVEEWDGYYAQLKQEKALFGYEKTTIVDVWNELEMRHSGGTIKRRFFSAFYMTNTFIFSWVKRLLVLSGTLGRVIRR